jgi:fructokinase
MDTRHIQSDSKRPTGHVSVDTTRPDKPTYVIHENVAWDSLVFDDAVDRLMKEASAVCFGTLAQRHSASRRTIRLALDAARNALIVYDLNLRQHFYQKDWVEDSLQAADVVKMNLDEVSALSETLESRWSTLREFADYVHYRYGVELVCITRGENGCLLFEGKDVAEEGSIRIHVEDGVGAGDAFTAALISSRLRGWALHTTAWFANHIGALVASKPGAMPRLEEEIGSLAAIAKSRTNFK